MTDDGSARFAGDTVVVTGSTRGIGEGIARRFASEGAAVVVNDHGAEDGERLATDISESTPGEVVYVTADVRDPDAVEALLAATVEEFGSVDVVVNNAAVETDTAADEATIEDWERVVDTGFRGYWLVARAAVRRMDEGAIVNVASNHAHVTTPRKFPYNAVKAGIEGMTRGMALDWGPSVRVNTVAPGWIAVDRTVGEMSDRRREELASIHPTGRIGRPEDVAGAVAFLASDDAAFVTGTTLLVDGGRTAVMQDDALPDYRARRE